MISRDKASARKLTRARLLLLAHAGEKDTALARALQTSVSPVERTRKPLVLEGWKAALEEDPRPGAKPRLDAQGHGFLVALACSTPPQGREGWTLELLSDRLVALGYVESFSKEAGASRPPKKHLQAVVVQTLGDPHAGSGVRLAHGSGDQPLHGRRRACSIATVRLL